MKATGNTRPGRLTSASTSTAGGNDHNRLLLERADFLLLKRGGRLILKG